MNKFTGDIHKFHKYRTLLQSKGYAVSDAIHIGEDKYEFTEDMWSNFKLGCHDIHVFLIWEDEEQNIKCLKKVIGSRCND